MAYYSGLWCTGVHYIPLLRCFWEAKVLFYHFFHNSSVWAVQLYKPWGSTIWSQHTDTIFHWCMALTVLKLQVLLGSESLQCGHILFPRMFKSWDRSLLQTSSGVFVFVCVSLSLSFVSLFFSHYILSLPPLSPSSTYQLKHCIKKFDFNVWQNIKRKHNSSKTT